MDECEQYLEMMSTMLDGELDEDSRAALMAHVSECPRCRASLAAFTALSDELRTPESVPDALCASVMAQVSASRPGKVIPWRRWAALAACLALVCAAGLRLLPGFSGSALDGGAHMATVMGELRAPQASNAKAAEAPEVTQPESALPESASDESAGSSIALFTSVPSESDYVYAVLSDTSNYAGAALNYDGVSYEAPDDETEALLLNLAYAADAEAPATEPEYTLDLSTGSLVELWETENGIICRLDGYVFTPSGSTETILELVREITE